MMDKSIKIWQQQRHMPFQIIIPRYFVNSVKSSKFINQMTLSLTQRHARWRREPMAPRKKNSLSCHHPNIPWFRSIFDHLITT